MQLVAKFVSLVWMQRKQQRFSYPCFFHLAIRFWSANFSFRQNSYNSLKLRGKTWIIEDSWTDFQHSGLTTEGPLPKSIGVTVSLVVNSLSGSWPRLKVHAREWTALYHGYSIDPTHQSHALDPALKASEARRTAPIQLLIKDTFLEMAFRR